MNIITLSGCSGSGKNYIAEKLIEKINNKNNIKSNFIVSFTTRQIRNGEINGKDYYFINVEEFENKIKNNEFLEYVKVNNNYYGTPYLNKKEDYFIHIVDPKGVENLRKIKKENKNIDLNVYSIFIKDKENGKILLQRLEDRITNSKTDKELEENKKRIAHLQEVELREWNEKAKVNELYNKILYVQDLMIDKDLDRVLEDLITDVFVENSMLLNNSKKNENENKNKIF